MLRSIAALAAIAAVLAAEPARAESAASTEARPTPKEWGDVGVEAVARFGQLMVPGAERGKSGILQSSGLQLRFMMPVGWGAYYRYTTGATRNLDRADWKVNEFVAGLSRRMLRVGGPSPWTFRAQAQFDVGFGYTQLGTHESCRRSFVPFGARCSDGPSQGLNVQGDALLVEIRLGGQVGIGPLSVGADVGVAGHLHVFSGDNSLSPPSTFLLPSGQLKLGLAWPFL